MICDKCKNRIEDNLKFCNNCGAEINKDNSENEVVINLDNNKEKPNDNPPHKSNTYVTSNESDSDEISGFKILIIFLLTIFILDGWIVFSLKNFISEESNLSGLEDLRDGRNIVIEFDNGESVSLEQHIYDLMSTDITDNYDFTPDDIKDFLIDDKITDAMNKIDYQYIQQFFSKDAPKITFEDYVNVFRDNKDIVNKYLNADFTTTDYEIMSIRFHNGFAGRRTTECAQEDYPLSIIRGLLSNSMIWFDISMVVVLLLFCLLRNGMKVIDMLKNLLIAIVISSFLTIALFIINLLTSNSVIVQGLLPICIIPALIAAGTLFVVRIKG